MKFLTFLYRGRRHAGVLRGDEVTPIEEINAKHGTAIPDDLLAIIRSGVRVRNIVLPPPEISSEVGSGRSCR
jgi:hypothetical protein